MLFRLFVLLFLNGFALSTQAQVYDELKGKFGAVLQVMDENFRAKAESVPRGTKLVAFIKLVGCSPNSSGNCDAEADVRIYNPLGAVDAHVEHAELWKKKAPAPGEVVTGLVMGVTVGPTDPTGKYRIEATVRDRVSAQTIELSTTFNVTK